jgi:hypothetical protein
VEHLRKVNFIPHLTAWRRQRHKGGLTRHKASLKERPPREAQALFCSLSLVSLQTTGDFRLFQLSAPTQHLCPTKTPNRWLGRPFRRRRFLSTRTLQLSRFTFDPPGSRKKQARKPAWRPRTSSSSERTCRPSLPRISLPSHQANPSLSCNWKIATRKRRRRRARHPHEFRRIYCCC